MQDGAETSHSPPVDVPSAVALPRRRKSGKALLVVALLAFVLGGTLAGWVVWRGDLDAVLPANRAHPAPPPMAERARPGEQAPDPAGGAPAPVEAGLGGVETRLALLEDRFSRINQQADAASANASRAEALLVALATRRVLDRGEPLGYLKDQLNLRFGSAQPQAVQTIIKSAENPVTLYLLSSQLEAAAPALVGERSDESTWTKVRRELASLFVVRRTASPATRQFDRAERAQVLLKAGRVDEAIAEVERLPGANDAQAWIAAARRYAEAQRALEIIETAAMLEPRGLRDGGGLAINQPSPLLPPAEKATSVN